MTSAELGADPGNQAVQDSDPIATVTLSAVDVGARSIDVIETSWTVDGGAAYDDLPAGLELSQDPCSSADLTLTRGWQLSGLADVPTSGYVVTVLVQDEKGYQASAEPASRFNNGGPKMRSALWPESIRMPMPMGSIRSASPCWARLGEP